MTTSPGNLYKVSVQQKTSIDFREQVYSGLKFMGVLKKVFDNTIQTHFELTFHHLRDPFKRPYQVFFYI